MGKKKETKPLLDKSKESLQSPQQQQPQQQIKKSSKSKGIGSGTTHKSKLASVHETSTETTDDMKNGKEKCHESTAESSTSNPSNPNANDEQTGAPYSYFGVKSYLHNFYESVSHPPGNHAEDDFHYLIHPKGRRCGAIWFKVGLIIGATLFLLGAVAIVIGYAIPRQDVIVGRNEEFEVVDKDAIRFNKNLDMCKLIGLAGFCSGGLVLVISLLAPTFTSTYWDDDPATEPFRVSLAGSVLHDEQPKSPIPVTEKIKCVQPIWPEQ